MSRLFTFGCSFTQYSWPTWADIAATAFDYSENWGKMGCGNSYILWSISECIQRNKIGPDDTVAVMWTSIAREDRWISKEGWLGVGSIYNQYVYPDNFVKELADPRGYLIRDLATINATHHMLKAVGCKYKFFKIVPFTQYDDSGLGRWMDPDLDIFKLYRPVLDMIADSVYEVVFNSDWYSRPGPVDIENLKNRYISCAGNDWPDWDNFISNELNDCSDEIRNEIKDNFGFDRDLIRSDPHPTPLEHLEYISKTWPEIDIDRSAWTDVEQQVQNVKKVSLKYFARKPKRF